MYYWSHFKNIQYFPLLFKTWNSLKTRSIAASRLIDYHMVLYLIAPEGDGADNHYKNCTPARILVITMGTNLELLFYNCPHVDNGDKYLEGEMNKLMGKMDYLKKFNDKANVHLNTFPNYLIKVHSHIGLSSPTTCCYQHIKASEDFSFHQFSVMQGLGCCVTIQDYTTHHFMHMHLCIIPQFVWL